jgi:hypothetical protein
MRDFLKSTLRFSWAMSLFGVQQLENIVSDPSQQTSKTATAFESVTQATEQVLNGVVKDAFKAGDRLQSGVVDAMLGPPTSKSQQPAAGSDKTGATQTASVHSGRLNTSTFVVLGEGLAAGAGDFTLSDLTQEDSFPAQMARQMQAKFSQRLIQAPGLFSPVGFAELPVIVPVPSQTSVTDQLPPTSVNNLSIPGYRLSDALNLRPSQPLVQRNDAKQTAANLILGLIPIAYGQDGQLSTQLEGAVNLKPTFTIVELGYYEALEAAVKGDPGKLPNINSFRSDYVRILSALRECGSESLVLTVPDPFDTAHFSSLTLAAKILKVEPTFLFTQYGLKPDDLVTPRGLNEIGFQLFGKQMDALPDGCVMSAVVGAEITNRINELNVALVAAAQECGALVYDLRAFFHRLKNEGLIVGSTKVSAEYLGGFYALNGYYPGATGQALIANEILHELNAAFGSDFPPVDLQAVIQTDPVAAYRQAEGPIWPADELSQHQGVETKSHPAEKDSAAIDGISRAQKTTGWQQLGQPQGLSPAQLQLPPTFEQILPLSKTASYFGDGIAAMNCRDPQGIQWGSCGNLLFGGLALVDSHLSGNIRIKFTPPADGLTRFEVSFLDGFTGDDSVLAAPQFFKMAFQQSRVDDVPGLVSSGTLNLTTGDVTDLKVYARYSSTALFALVSVNPSFPRQPLGFPGPYGSASAKFEQRTDGLLDFTFYGSTYVPLGNNIRWPLNFFSSTQQFATIPANGTVMHPHLHLSTKEPQLSPHDVCPDVPFNTVQELTLFTHNSSFGDAFTLNSSELGGAATGRSHVLGRAMIQFGARTGNTVPVAISLLNAGGVMAEMSASPITQVFPGRLYPGPHGFDEFLRFPLRTYSLDDLAILDDPFDISTGVVDLRTGKFLNELLHRGFINQDLIFALLRVEPRTPKDSFFFRGPAALERGASGQLIFRFEGEVHIPYPGGFLFPTPNLTTGIVIGPNSALDPFLWIHAIQDADAPHSIKEGGGQDLISSTAERFSYHYRIPSDPEHHKASFEYENHTQQGKFRMHSLAWVGFSNSGNRQRGSKEYDTVSFTGFGVWSKGDSQTVQQATVQVSTSSTRPYVGIQIDSGNVSNVNTKPVSIQDARP